MTVFGTGYGREESGLLRFLGTDSWREWRAECDGDWEKRAQCHCVWEQDPGKRIGQSVTVFGNRLL